MQTFTIEDNIITVEDVLEKLGGFSFFQIWVAFVILIAEIPTSANTLLLIFTGSNNVEYSCVTTDSQIVVSAKDPDFCDRNCTLVLDPDLPHSSIVQEWNLICDRSWISDLFTSIQMMGMMLGALIASQLADTYGRKTVFFSMIATMGIFGLTSGLVDNLYLFGVTRFLAGIGIAGFYATFFIYLMEFLTPSWRTIAGCVTLWSVGICALALLAYLIPSWRYLTCATSAGALVTLIFYPFIPETPRWLLCKEKTEKAEKCLKLIAKLNRKPVLESSVIQTLQKTVLSEQDSETQAQSTWEVYKNPELRYRLVIFLLGYCTVSMTYYSMSFNTKNISGNPYINVLYMGLVDLPAFPSGVLFNNWIGRKRTYAGYLIFATIFLFAYIFIDLTFGVEEHEHLVKIISYLGRFGIAGAWGVLCCFAAESFPTVCRSTALGMCAFSANVGGVIAPQLAYLGSVSHSAPYFIYAGLSLTAASSAYFLPETNKKPLKNFIANK